MFENVYNINKSKLESIVKRLVGNELDPLLDYLANTDFYYSPAARFYHDNYPGGLYDHCEMIASKLWNFRSEMKKDWSDLEILIIAFGHDLCKIGLYIPSIDEFGNITYSYNPEYSRDRGHGTKSLQILAEIIPHLLNERIAESIVCHMGLWTEDVENIGVHMREAQTKDDLVFFTHCADMISSRMGRSAKSVKMNNDTVEIEY